MQVASVLEGSASKSDWAAIRRCSLTMTVEIWKEMMAQMSMTMSRDSTSVSESTGGLASNDSLDHLRSSAEPVGDFEQADFDHLPAWLDVVSFGLMSIFIFSSSTTLPMTWLQ